jgi:hypothetical protein
MSLSWDFMKLEIFSILFIEDWASEKIKNWIYILATHLIEDWNSTLENTKNWILLAKIGKWKLICNKWTIICITNFEICFK